MLRREDVRRGVNDSLKRLQTDYIDLYLIHWPAAGADNSNLDGLGEKNPEYRKLAWDELTQIFKSASLSYFYFYQFLLLSQYVHVSTTYSK